MSVELKYPSWQMRLQEAILEFDTEKAGRKNPRG